MPQRGRAGAAPERSRRCGPARPGRAAVGGREQIAGGGIRPAYPEPTDQCAGSAALPLGKASMEQSHTSRLARWASPPLPALDLSAGPATARSPLAQLGPVFGVLLLLVCDAAGGSASTPATRSICGAPRPDAISPQFREPPVADAWRHLSAVWQAEQVAPERCSCGAWRGCPARRWRAPCATTGTSCSIPSRTQGLAPGHRDRVRLLRPPRGLHPRRQLRSRRRPGAARAGGMAASAISTTTISRSRAWPPRSIASSA